ncbi:MAG: VOC family protein [Dehalococcoidia bacterium]|nr:VOC family protein [Dehalococcoidia bacterium]
MPKPELSNRINNEFEFRGLNHLALVCKDMQRTVDFYQGVLGMPLVKTIELPGGMGQHFFFDMGNGDSLAFFWFPTAPEAAPGVSSAAHWPGDGEIVTAHGSMNHVAFDVPGEQFEAYVEKLHEKGIKTSRIYNHDDSPAQVSREMHEGVFVRSVYFMDPDGILLEFASWTKVLDPDVEVRHRAATAEDARRQLATA